MNNELNSVEDIDAMLDSEFHLNDEQANDNSENIEETSGDVTNQEPEDDENLNSDEDENTNDDVDSSDENQEKSDTKPSADDKKEFAFSKMRKENSDLKNKLNEKNEETEFLNLNYKKVIKELLSWRKNKMRLNL